MDDRRVACVSLARYDDDPAALLALMAARTDGRRTTPISSPTSAVSASRCWATPRRASPRPSAPARFPSCSCSTISTSSSHRPATMRSACSSPEYRAAPSSSRRVAGSSPTWRGCELRVTRWSSWPATWPSTPPAPPRSSPQAHLSITPEIAAEVTDRTEGWPVGLYLAAVIAKDSKGEELTISGDDRYVADYLYRESLLQLPESTQRFLRRTSVLDQLSAPLAMRSSESLARPRNCATWKPRACSSFRSTVGGSGTATTPCSESSCSGSCVESSPKPSPSCTCEPPTGTSPMDPQPWRSSISSTPRNSSGACNC